VAKVKQIAELAEKEGMMLELNAQVKISFKEPHSEMKKIGLDIA